ncbi:tricyclene synthase Oc15, chloroplastic [Sesamum indicum]|uniref:Tricyclene synthase Oc15, chloroplastic n=1 Tax=Sesamum indicum TaxID=4182 RepID=A0A6I9U5Z4_SESIN|nr:tricyclene synthase Oc15, chloroplastic [Sesamum indicum]
MASWVNGFSRSFLPCSLENRPGLAKIGKREPVPVVSFNGARKQKWNINVRGVAQTSGPSRLHQDCPDNFAIEYEEKIDEIRQLLRSKGEDDPSESLVLVDAIQRGGLSSYYEEEIESLIQKHYVASCASIYGYYSLRDVSLLFRLLRQHGHYISPDVFNNFKGKDGRFRRNLSQDIRGLMELYEVAQLSFQGEYILDEAASFSGHILREYCLANVDNNLSRMVTGKLRYPYHKTIPRLTRKDFLQDIEGINGWGKTLRELALMDLRKGQSVFQGELAQVSKWWNELGLAKKLKLVRNQLPKWYTWSMSVLIDDFSLSLQRVEITKSTAFIYLIDDIFDVVGTLNELTIFTEAVNKWEYAAVNMLPDYMKMCYRALLDTTNDIGREIYKRHGHNPIDSLKTSWASLCNAYLVEAKWFASGVSPTADMHLENGKVSTGVYVALVHLFFLLGLGRTDGGTINFPDISQLLSDVATIFRLCNDLGGAKDGNEDGTDGSYIDLCMKDHPGVSVAQARERVVDVIASQWKSLNKECFRLNHSSASSFKKASLNLARIVPLMYDYDDNQRLPVLEEYVKFTLFNQTNTII